MKNSIKYSEVGKISKDLLRLYCKIKHSKIEDMYIKLAKVNFIQFSKWLHSKNGKLIQDKMENPDVYTALEALDYLNNSQINHKSLGQLVSSLMHRAKYTHVIPTIVGLTPFINGEFGDILKPFSDIIKTISHIKHQDGSEVEGTSNIQNDLSLIKNEFSKSPVLVNKDKKLRPAQQTLIKQRREIFSTLLKRFSNELASASEVQGFNELASAFRNNILAVPAVSGLSKYIELDSITEDQMRHARRLAEYVLNYPSPEYANQHHDLVEMDLLQQAGSLSEEDVYKFKEAFESKRNVMDYLNDQESIYVSELPGIESEGKITSDIRMNPDYIYMLSVFFLIMQMKLKIPAMSVGLM